jgi:membrane protein implicated in regulation of membrane protease activity
MTVASFLAFFGFTGMIVYSHLAALGALTIIPSALAAVVLTRFTLNIMSLVLNRLEGRGVASMSDLVGLMGTVTISIEPGLTGQITYSVEGKRERCPARSLTGEATFRRGTRVMIAEVRDRVAYVEPWTDAFLLESESDSLFAPPDKDTMGKDDGV